MFSESQTRLTVNTGHPSIQTARLHHSTNKFRSQCYKEVFSRGLTGINDCFIRLLQQDPAHRVHGVCLLVVYAEEGGVEFIDIVDLAGSLRDFRMSQLPTASVC